MAVLYGKIKHPPLLRFLSSVLNLHCLHRLPLFCCPCYSPPLCQSLVWGRGLGTDCSGTTKDLTLSSCSIFFTLFPVCKRNSLSTTLLTILQWLEILPWNRDLFQQMFNQNLNDTIKTFSFDKDSFFKMFPASSAHNASVGRQYSHIKWCGDQGGRRWYSLFKALSQGTTNY